MREALRFCETCVSDRQVSSQTGVELCRRPPRSFALMWSGHLPVHAVTVTASTQSSGVASATISRDVPTIPLTFRCLLTIKRAACDILF